ncbi:YadA-like family protein [Streptobacillus felis]|uniref:YadA-like family protein n=1 Tax=Streptobacillus felis TaxID=1384509 RepID=A0A7Z0PEH2_9FUSO|nr:YadA-like family protein [Streptobacillus felis]NYV27746.1 YadA-like family protein [Streptobacillus felis]
MKKRYLYAIIAFLSVTSFSDTIYQTINNISGTNNYGNGTDNFILGLDQKADGSRKIELGNIIEDGTSMAIAIGATNRLKAGDQGNVDMAAIGYKNVVGNRWAVATGAWNHALGYYSTAVGIESNSVGSESAAVGRYAGSKGKNSAAFGNRVIARAENSTAFGVNTESIGLNSVAFGNKVIAKEDSSTVFGFNSHANSKGSIAIGNNITNTGENSVSVGYQANTNGKNSISVGHLSLANGESTTVFGNNSSSTGIRSIALGSSVNSIGSESVALGSGVTSRGNKTVAIGANQTQAIGESSVAIGDYAWTGPTGERGIAIGSRAFGYLADSITIGSNSETNALNAIAIGKSAQARNENAIALGANSVTSAPTPFSNANIDGGKGEVTYGTFAGNTPTSVVSIGNENDKRQLKNVAAGEISSSSTDAINGSQLFFVAEKVSLLHENPITFEGNTGKTDKKKLSEELNFEIKGENGITTSAAGNKVTINVEKGNVVSNTLEVTNGEGRVIGTDDLTIELKDGTITKDKLSKDLSDELDGKLNASDLVKGNLTGNGITVTGNGKLLDSNLELSITDGAITKDKLSNDLKNEIDNKLSDENITNEYLTNKLEKGNVISNTLTVNNGNGRILGTEDLSIELKDGAITKDKLSDDLKNELDGKLSASDLVKGNLNGNGITVTGNGKLLDSDLELSITDGAITKDKLSDDLKNELDGKLSSSDLVKGNLNGTGITVTGNGKLLDSDLELSITDGAITKDKLSDDLKNELDGKLNALDLVKGNLTGDGITVTGNGKVLDGDLNISIDKSGKVEAGDNNLVTGDTVFNAINKADDKIKQAVEKATSAASGVASAVAMANLPQVSNIAGHRHNIAGAYGYYNGEHAFALGLSGLNETGNLVYKASGSLNTKGHVALGAGLGYQFDKLESRRKDMLTLQRNGNINLLDEKVYELENRVENLENKILELEKMLQEVLKK